MYMQGYHKWALAHSSSSQIWFWFVCFEKKKKFGGGDGRIEGVVHIVVGDIFNNLCFSFFLSILFVKFSINFMNFFPPQNLDLTKHKPHKLCMNN